MNTIISCENCWWNTRREQQAPCAYCGSSYGVFNQYLEYDLTEPIKEFNEKFGFSFKESDFVKREVFETCDYFLFNRFLTLEEILKMYPDRTGYYKENPNLTIELMVNKNYLWSNNKYSFAFFGYLINNDETLDNHRMHSSQCTFLIK